MEMVWYNLIGDIMKNYNNDIFKNSDFWKFLVENIKVIINDMDNFNDTGQLYEKKINSINQTLLSFVLMMKFIAFEEEIVDPKKSLNLLKKCLAMM